MRASSLWFTFTLLILVLSTIGSAMMPSTAVGAVAGDGDDDMFQGAHRASAGKTRGRAYVGARDEQGVEVQLSLAQPSRNPDGTASVPDDDDDGPHITAPETD